MKSVTFKYPEVIHNHFMFRYAVDDHNGKQHSPISLKVVWARKRWAYRVFAFLLSFTEVNCFLAELLFMDRKSGSMTEFQKQLVYELINSWRMTMTIWRRRRQHCIGGQPESKKEFVMVCSLFHCSKICWDKSHDFHVQIPPPPPPSKANIGKERYARIAGAP